MYSLQFTQMLMGSSLTCDIPFLILCLQLGTLQPSCLRSTGFKPRKFSLSDLS